MTAICDYLEPQFDRLNINLLEHALEHVQNQT